MLTIHASAMFGYSVGLANGGTLTATPTAGTQSHVTAIQFSISTIEDQANQTAEGLVVFTQVV